MNKEGKIWGCNTLLFKNDNTQVNYIFVKKGGRCSKHIHKNKHNIFFVNKGKLLIESWQANNIIDETILGEEQKTSIPPNTPHRFTALEDTYALEIYHTSIQENDIEREDQGTMLL